MQGPVAMSSSVGGVCGRMKLYISDSEVSRTCGSNYRHYVLYGGYFLHGPPGVSQTAAVFRADDAPSPSIAGYRTRSD